jgi:hypothetical protein
MQQCVASAMGCDAWYHLLQWMMLQCPIAAGGHIRPGNRSRGHRQSVRLGSRGWEGRDAGGCQQGGCPRRQGGGQRAAGSRRPALATLAFEGKAALANYSRTHVGKLVELRVCTNLPVDM